MKAPWLTDIGEKTLQGGYLLPGETQEGMFKRLANAASHILGRPDLTDKFFNMLWNNWLCPASPVASNLGTQNLPISCYASSVNDSTSDIFQHYHEIAMLSKYGGGTGSYWGNIRPRGTAISKGGTSDGIVPWLKVLEGTINSVSQAGVRRGAVAAYLDVEHLDIEEFIGIRHNNGDISRKALSVGFHHGVCISDKFMEDAIAGKTKERYIFNEIMKHRVETGEPYLMFKDTANRTMPNVFKTNNLKIETSNLCSEIFLPTDKDHTFVCCLSSLNLARYDEWKDTDTVYYATMFLDAVMQDFINKTTNIQGFEKSRNFAIKSRSLGLGALGWHTLLQQKGLPFDSFQSMTLNAQIFSQIQKQSQQASRDMAIKYGEPEWCKGSGLRNSTTMAVAPTVSNSIISGGLSQGIEPISSNVYMHKTAKGSFLRKNPILESLLELKGMNTADVWIKINNDKGSVRNLNLSSEEKLVFLTAREINQFAIIKQASQRQKFIDQGQSVNLYFALPTEISDPIEKKKLSQYMLQVHIEAWRSGLKSLYYMKTESILKGEPVFQDSAACAACEG